jgi:hypothetical protein
MNPFLARIRSRTVPPLAIGGVPHEQPVPRVRCPAPDCPESFTTPLDLLAHLSVCVKRAAA